MELGGRRGWMLGADLEKEAALFGTILLAVDGSSYAEKAVQLTRRLAAGGDDEVVVAHVSEFLPAPFQTWNALVRPCWSAPCCRDRLAFGATWACCCCFGARACWTWSWWRGRVRA